MGCDYYIFKYLVVTYTYQSQPQPFELELEWGVSRGYFSEYTEEEKEIIFKPVPDKLYKLKEYDLAIIKQHIIKLHDFLIPDEEFVTDIPQVSETDIESYNKVSKLFVNPPTTYKHVMEIIKSKNNSKLADFNYLKHIKIIDAVIKTSKRLRT